MGGAVSVPILLAMGAAVGAASGALIAYVRLPAIIVGLCALFVLTGVAQEILLMPEQSPGNWTEHLGAKVGPIPGALITMAVPLIVWFGLRRTPFVRAMFSVGGDAPTAFATGINVPAVRILAYALGGMFAAIAGLALTGIIRSADSSLGLQYTLIAIAAVSLGGTPSRGRPRGALRRAARRDVHLPHPEPALRPGGLRAVARRRLRLRADRSGHPRLAAQAAATGGSGAISVVASPPDERRPSRARETAIRLAGTRRSCSSRSSSRSSCTAR